MIISLSGVVSEERESVFKELQNLSLGYQFLNSPILYLTKAIGIKPLLALSRNMEACTMTRLGLWNVIDSQANPFLKKDATIIVNGSPLDDYADYRAFRDPEKKVGMMDNLIEEMTQYYCNSIDKYIHFPLDENEKRTSVYRAQEEALQRGWDLFGIPAEKRMIASLDKEKRLDEIVEFISK